MMNVMETRAGWGFWHGELFFGLFFPKQIHEWQNFKIPAGFFKKNMLHFQWTDLSACVCLLLLAFCCCRFIRRWSASPEFLSRLMLLASSFFSFLLCSNQLTNFLRREAWWILCRKWSLSNAWYSGRDILSLDGFICLCFLFFTSARKSNLAGCRSKFGFPSPLLSFCGKSLQSLSMHSSSCFTCFQWSWSLALNCAKQTSENSFMSLYKMFHAVSCVISLSSSGKTPWTRSSIRMARGSLFSHLIKSGLTSFLFCLLPEGPGLFFTCLRWSRSLSLNCWKTTPENSSLSLYTPHACSADSSSGKVPWMRSSRRMPRASLLLQLIHPGHAALLLMMVTRKWDVLCSAVTFEISSKHCTGSAVTNKSWMHSRWQQTNPFFPCTLVVALCRTFMPEWIACKI